MRTKTFLLTAALGAAGIATSMAQVYSVNAVGYVNVAITNLSASAPTYLLLSNPLNISNNLVSAVVPSPPEGTTLLFFRGSPPSFAEQETYFGSETGWYPGTNIVAPGEGFFAVLPPAAPGSVTTLTFVGEVPQGILNNVVPTGYSIRASMVPQSGNVTILGLQANEGDLLLKFNRDSQGYDTYTLFPQPDGWQPAEPVIGVAEGFFFFNTGASAINWERTFSVN